MARFLHKRDLEINRAKTRITDQKKLRDDYSMKYEEQVEVNVTLETTRVEKKKLKKDLEKKLDEESETKKRVADIKRRLEKEKRTQERTLVKTRKEISRNERAAATINRKLDGVQTTIQSARSQRFRLERDIEAKLEEKEEVKIELEEETEQTEYMAKVTKALEQDVDELDDEYEETRREQEKEMEIVRKEHRVARTKLAAAVKEEKAAEAEELHKEM